MNWKEGSKRICWIVSIIAGLLGYYSAEADFRASHSKALEGYNSYQAAKDDYVFQVERNGRRILSFEELIAQAEYEKEHPEEVKSREAEYMNKFPPPPQSPDRKS